MQFPDEHLIQKIQEGDRATFKLIFEHFYGPLCDYAFTIVKNSHIAEDQVQEVFVNIWEQKDDWSPKGTIKSYLYKAVRNQSLNYLRHQRIVEDWKQDKTSSTNTTIHPKKETKADLQQLKQWIQEAIDELPEKRRRIYELSRNHGLTYKEIAQALDISIKTVETQMGRSLSHLRNWLGQRLA